VLPEGVTARLQGKDDRKSLKADGTLIEQGEETKLGAGEHTITFSI